MRYSITSGAKKKKTKLTKTISLAIALLIPIVIVIGSYIWYEGALSPLSTKSDAINVTIQTGSTADQISQLLQDKKVIRSAFAFSIYLRIHGYRGNLQAGKYTLDSSDSIIQIVGIISGGKIDSHSFTILPAQRLDQVRQSFLDAGYSKSSVDKAFDPNTYPNESILSTKPPEASLEGYLYPDTFGASSTTTPSDIIKKSLDEMGKIITPDMVAAYQNKNLSVFQAITLASIVEHEVSNDHDRQMVAQVFLNRLKIGMMLGSDVTYQYVAAVTGQSPSPSIDSPYNTRKYVGLPPGPISNVSKSSLMAVAYPIANSYLFFVAGDDGSIHFANTQAQQDANTQAYCKVLCSTY
jgi:UPF0755 protein